MRNLTLRAYTIRTVVALGFFAIAYNNCAKVFFKDEPSAPPGQQGPVCQRRIDPNACPLDGTASIEGTCSTAECSDTQISRYRALILAFKARGTQLCVISTDIFNDTVCPAGGGGDSRLCTPQPGSIPPTNARDCIDAAASAPAITNGIGNNQFGHIRISYDQAISFGMRALQESKCGVILFNQLQNDGQSTNRQNEIGGYNSSLWPYVYMAYKVGLINAATARDSGTLFVSDSQMNTYLSELKNKMASLGCSEFSSQVL